MLVPFFFLAVWLSPEDYTSFKEKFNQLSLQVHLISVTKTYSSVMGQAIFGVYIHYLSNFMRILCTLYIYFFINIPSFLPLIYAS